MSHDTSDTTREKVTDPVCNMTFAAEKAVATAEYGGVTYYFCTEACHRQFVQNPDQYIANA
jgi:Cu+-exporting ATPase